MDLYNKYFFLNLKRFIYLLYLFIYFTLKRFKGEAYKSPSGARDTSYKAKPTHSSFCKCLGYLIHANTDRYQSYRS